MIIAQISDMHIGASAKLRGETPAGNLLRALEAIGGFHPDLILATGDLVNNEGPEEYQELAELLSVPPAPVFLLPGNHDNPAIIKRYFPTHYYLPDALPLSYVIDDFPVRIVAVDQTEPGLVGGRFTRAHADWMDRTLKRSRKKPTIVALHHPPFPTHDRLFDTIGLEGADLFAKVIAGHPQVGRVICGHHHRLTTGKIAHAPVVSAPSTAWIYGLAFHPEDKVATITDEPPGFLLHVWSEEAGFATHLINF
ncbi:MAG: metallophosphoesterase [Caulobacterales bacterium]